MSDEFRSQQHVKSDAAKDEKPQRDEEEDERVFTRVFQSPFRQNAVDGND